MRRAVIVVNPVSGASSRQADLLRFAAELRERGFDAVVRATRGRGDASVIAHEEAASGADLIVAAGGDGTLNEVASGVRRLCDGAPPVAILPLGTSNLVARELRVPFNAREAAIVAADGEPFEIDAADVTDGTGRPARTMLACAGVGWDAHVVRSLSEQRKGHITFGTWLRPIASALRDYRFPRFRVTATSGPDAGRVEEGVFAIALNCAPYAAFFLPEPAARPDDGLVDLLLVRNASALTMLRLAWKARRFGHRRNTLNTMANDQAVVTLRGRSFRIDGDTAVPYQIDGDVGGVTAVDILVRPRAIRLMRPRPTPEVSKNA